MKRICLLFLSAFWGVCGSTFGSTTLTVTDADGNSASSSSGTVAADATQIGSGIMKYTISGLTLDGVGSADDSITLQFSISAATGGTPILTFTDDFGVDGGGTQINAGETLAFAFTSGSVLLNAGGDGGMNVLFDGFSAMDANNIATVGNEGFNLTFNSSTTTRNTSDPISFGGLFSTFQVAGITAAQFNTALSRTDGIDSAFSINAFDFRVTVAVPEPSHASLLMLSALGLFRRRRMSLLAR